jgi:hypothetical protein
MDFKMYVNKVQTAELLYSMRLIGLEINLHMNQVIGKNHKQFLIASAVSRREIETKTFHVLLNDTYSHFLRLLNGVNGLYGRGRFLKFKRVVFLMNSKDKTGQNRHTEARLFDPKGVILNNIQASCRTAMSESGLQNNEEGFLACLRNDFRKEFGSNEECIIAMFSFFLPCTQKDHMCSMLVGKYAEISKTRLIISYEMPFKTTHKELSLWLMNSDKILIIHPEFYQIQTRKFLMEQMLLQSYLNMTFCFFPQGFYIAIGKPPFRQHHDPLQVSNYARESFRVWTPTHQNLLKLTITPASFRIDSILQK